MWDAFQTPSHLALNPSYMASFVTLIFFFCPLWFATCSLVASLSCWHTDCKKGAASNYPVIQPPPALATCGQMILGLLSWSGGRSPQNKLRSVLSRTFSSMREFTPCKEPPKRVGRGAPMSHHLCKGSWQPAGNGRTRMEPRSPPQPCPPVALLPHIPGWAGMGVQGASASPGDSSPPPASPWGEVKMYWPWQSASARHPVGSAWINHQGVSQAQLLPSTFL